MSTATRPLRCTTPLSLGGGVPAIAVRLGDAAKAIGVSTRTVRRLVESGDLPASRIGRALLIAVADLEALLARTKIGAAP